MILPILNILNDVNISTLLLAFIPACINISILFYILRCMPKGRMINIFSIFLLALLSWQLEDTFVRLNITIDEARFIDKFFNPGWLAVGPLLLHFVVIFTREKILHSRLFYLLVYGPYFIFLSLDHSSSIPVPLVEHGLWGYIVEARPETTDQAQRYWLAAMVFLAWIILFKFALSERNQIQKRNQAFLISLGILLPTIQGVVTQLIFPLLGKEEIPVTSSFMTFLSVAIIISFKKYRLFEISESIPVEGVLDKLTSLVFFISSNEEIIYLNNESSKIFFGKENNTICIPLSDIFIPDDTSFAIFKKKIFNRHKSIKPVKNLESTFLNFKKKPIHVLVASQPIYNNRKFQGVLIFANDITERFVSQQKIKLSNERYNFVSKATDEAIWDLDLENNTIHWGEGYNEIFGYKIKGGTTNFKHWEKRVHPEDYPLVTKSFQKYLRGQKQKWEVEYRYQRSDGTYAYVLDRGYILRNSQGVPIRVIGAIQDMTKLKSYIKKIENQNSILNEIAWLQSHVVRAPLARIMGLAMIMEKQSIFEKEDENEFTLEHLILSCKELDDVIHKIIEKTTELKNRQ